MYQLPITPKTIRKQHKTSAFKAMPWCGKPLSSSILSLLEKRSFYQNTDIGRAPIFKNSIIVSADIKEESRTLWLLLYKDNGLHFTKSWKARISKGSIAQHSKMALPLLVMVGMMLYQVSLKQKIGMTQTEYHPQPPSLPLPLCRLSPLWSKRRKPTQVFSVFTRNWDSTQVSFCCSTNQSTTYT